ncbi:hypothetical protein H6F61_01225 [Cyanobacteria bacterium FACHB-472]|nr:hypothetical protein [Cyanobacteria bacterium FACHB-472]
MTLTLYKVTEARKARRLLFLVDAGRLCFGECDRDRQYGKIPKFISVSLTDSTALFWHHKFVGTKS